MLGECADKWQKDNVQEVVNCVMDSMDGEFRGQKGLCPLEKSQEMPQYVFCPFLLHFQNQRYNEKSPTYIQYERVAKYVVKKP